MPLNYKDYYKVLVASTRRRPRKTSSRPRTGSSRARGIPTRTRRDSKKPKRSSRRFKKRTKCSATPRSARSTTSSGNDWQLRGRRVPAPDGAAGRRDRPVQTPSRTFSPAASRARRSVSNRRPAGQPSGFSDFFDAFFHQHRETSGDRRIHSEGGDLETTIDLTLTEAYRGGSKSVTLQIEDGDSACNRDGRPERPSLSALSGHGPRRPDQALRRHDSERRPRRPARSPLGSRLARIRRRPCR